MNKQKTVFVGLSGGVDSSVAALRLKTQGYFVVGVFIKVWQPDFINCNWEAERLDAMRVAAHLDIPFLTCDAVEAYKKEVADYFISEYKIGRTPNPDVMCNKAVKFGAFYDFAISKGADFVATGHYAQIEKSEQNFLLKRSIDTNKDQSYFLWTLKKDQLKNILLPVGSSTKDIIRQEAAQAKIPVANKKDSQGICFLGHIDIPEFLSHFIKLEVGEVLDEEGNKVGVHQGAAVYTTGQRHGFIINESSSEKPVYYVTSRDLAGNTITVSHNKPHPKFGEKIKLENLNILVDKINVNEEIYIQTRYRQTPSLTVIHSLNTDEATITLSPKSDIEIITAGQSCVLYRYDVCLGGGIIAS
jgi:tRNA-specific 2-thiouridylase